MTPNPPPPLQQAMQNSSKQFGVPYDILAGVWQIESGGNYPNNFVNSKGYGGLFGTTDWNGSTQQQSDYAASILANLYHTYGSWAAALYHYSGGAYTSVPGQTTSGGSFTPPSKTSSASGDSSNSSSGNPLDIAGAISNLPNTIFQGLAPVGIGIGFGLVALGLIVGGVLIVALPSIQSAVKTVKP